MTRTRTVATHERWRLLLGLGALLFLASCPIPVTADGWFVVPGLRTAGGHESALIVDPGGAAVVIPGGGFFDLSPTLLVRRLGENDQILEVGTQATIEHFLNDVGRTLYGQVLWADFTRRLSQRTRFRASLSGNYFDDSEQRTLRRISGGAEVGIDYSVGRWIVKGFASGRRVGYPNVDVTETSGSTSTYHETRWSGGGAGFYSINRSLSLSVSVWGQGTSSIDPDFDSIAFLADMGFSWLTWRGLGVRGYYSRQDRSFTSRPSDMDSDEYQQWGAGLSYGWKNNVSVTFRWSEGRYVDTTGANSPTDRVELALGLGPSVFGFRTPERGLRLDTPNEDSLNPDLQRQTRDGVLFRVHAPEGRVVEVSGDFNGWGRSKLLLQPTGDGWWELRIPLPPGRYQYVYMIDGRPTTPPESVITIEDGFGGQNGYLEVLR